jgi:hypothetical protein
MPVESADDRLTFLDPDEFGTEAAYTPLNGTAADIAGIFNNPHLPVVVGEHVATSDAQPTFLCRTDDIPADAQGGDAGDTLAVDGVTYRVTDLHPDGSGMTLVVLGG